METREKLIQICGWIEITLSIVLNSGYVLSGARETEKHTKATSNIIQCELQLHWNYASVENNYSVIHAFIFLADKDITQLFAGRHSWVERPKFTYSSHRDLSHQLVPWTLNRPRFGRDAWHAGKRLHKGEKERCNSWLCTCCHILSTFSGVKKYIGTTSQRCSRVAQPFWFP